LAIVAVATWAADINNNGVIVGTYADGVDGSKSSNGFLATPQGRLAYLSHVVVPLCRAAFLVKEPSQSAAKRRDFLERLFLPVEGDGFVRGSNVKSQKLDVGVIISGIETLLSL
jgi:hypothetical protein